MHQKAPIMYEIRTRATNIQAETGSKGEIETNSPNLSPSVFPPSDCASDLQTVGVHLRLLYRPDQENLPRIHSRLGPDYDERVLPSIGNEILKAVVVSSSSSFLLSFIHHHSNKHITIYIPEK